MLLYNKKIRWIQCIFCTKFLGKKKGSVFLFCKAFKKQIPDDILIGKFEHTVKHPGQDNDIVFEKIK